MKILIPYFLIFLLTWSCTTKPPTDSDLEATTTDESTIEEIQKIEIGSVQISTDKIVASIKSYAYVDSTVVDSILNDYLFRKQVILEAINQGYLNDELIKDEIKTYSELMSEGYIVDSSLHNEMLLEAYNNMQKEINASHIFIALPAAASPSDTNFIYSELVRIKNSISTEAQFDSLARVYSQDRKTAKNGGNLGWFSALQMIYPIERVAYKLKINEISDPVRSELGYHLIKLNDIRPSKGRVQVAHLLKAVPMGADSTLKNTIRTKADSLGKLINSGESFEKLVEKHSDDSRTNKQGGILPWLTVGGRYERTFENVAFGLEIGEVSNVIETNSGYHILKCIDKKPVEAFEDIVEELEKKITTDSRGEYLEEQSIKRYATKLEIRVKPNVIQKLIDFFDVSLLKGEWKAPSNFEDITLIEHLRGDVHVSDFFDFVKYQQEATPVPKSFNLEMALNFYFNQFFKAQRKEIVVNQLGTLSDSYKANIESVKEDLLYSKFINKEIYEKAVSDTVGQRITYNKFKSNYKKESRVYGTLITTPNRDFAFDLYDAYEIDSLYRLKRGLRPIYFPKNTSSLTSTDKDRLIGLVDILNKNPSYIVEVGGHLDVAENFDTSGQRIQEVLNFLLGNGIPLTRIKEVDYGVTQLVDKFDWERNQRVSIQFFSRDFLDLLPSLDTEKQLLSKVERKWFEKSTLEELNIQAEIGPQIIQVEDDFLFFVPKKIEPEGIYDLRQVRARVISDYQKVLLEQKRSLLNEKYPVVYNSEVLNELKSEILK